MTIVHHLTKNNNYSRFDNCPICGNTFKKEQLFVEDKSRIHLEDKVREIAVDDDYIIRNKLSEFEQRCSCCTFNVIYKLDLEEFKKVKSVNNNVKGDNKVKQLN
jgi:hypothetical protein